ncbi:outer membrane protein assembly factor BamB family protein [Nucisporomicrobium flavum]|uniref:outer membrane protein assembly factor BamB family protein n=1 Tax=Nucisporomicrobium flavum TaxID=2785915 RepID=UPI0018F43CC6|nr:PQQ-binding-like beta-propeller repeat protein [Nucisporomicrobium flavum]
MQLTRTGRFGLALATVLAGLVLPSSPSNAAAPTANWAQDGYGPGHTSYNPAESVINSSTVGKLKTRWTVTPKAGPDSCPLDPVAPVVVGGRMFVLEPDGNGVGAYDTKTGKRLWAYTAGYLEATGLAVAGGTVVVTDINCFSNSNYDSNVIALDAATGAERWSSLTWWTTDTVVVDAGTVAVSGFCGTCDGEEHGVEAFRLSDGASLWSRPNAVLAGPVSSGGRILLAGTRTAYTEAVSIATGTGPWMTGLRYSASAADPARAQYYVSGTPGLRALATGSGKTLWTVKHESGDLATDGRRVYVASAGRINAYDPKNGKLLWTRKLATPGNLVRAGGLLYATSGTKLLVLAPTSGTTIRPFGTATRHVVVAGGRLYVTNGRTVRAYTP